MGIIALLYHLCRFAVISQVTIVDNLHIRIFCVILHLLVTRNKVDSTGEKLFRSFQFLSNVSTSQIIFVSLFMR